MTPLVVVAVLVLVGVLLVVPDPHRRLRRLTPAAAGAEAARGDGPTVTSWLRGVRAALEGRRVRGSGVDDAARTVAELAALLRAGLPSHQVWSYLPATSLPWPVSEAGRGARPLGGPVPRAPGPGLGWDRLLREAERASRRGDSVAAVLRAEASCCAPEVRTVARSLAAAWDVSERTGAPAAAVLDRFADSLRAESDARGARTAAMAGPRATARVLAWLPVLGLALGQLVGADPLHVLLGTPLGRVCAVIGALLALTSAAWTRRLVRVAEAPP